ncbi:MAG: tyrosine-type recombinase/integrase [Thermodesulfobacteriota bacterium]
MEKTDLKTWTERYQNHLIVLNYSHRTIKNHMLLLNRFLAYLIKGGIQDIQSVTKETIRGYQTHLYQGINSKGEPNTVSTQNKALSVVKTFFHLLCEEGFLVGDPSKDITYAREPKRLPRSILTKKEMKKLLNAPDTKTILGYRDRTILEILYSTGIRKEEINNLTLQDIDYNEGYIRVNSGKGKKDRVVPMGKIACRYLENYIKAVRPSLIRDPYNNHLFLSLRGNRLSKNMVWEIVKRYAKKARIKKTVSPHTFRHTCATLMLRNKANIRHIQEMLGHTSLTSTQVYASVSIADLKEVHTRCHPREKDKG